MQLQVLVDTVEVSKAGPGFPEGARVVELQAFDGKHYYHGMGLIPAAQAHRLAARVIDAGQIDPNQWGCYEDEAAERQFYHESGQAAADEREAERFYDDNCRASFQAILAAEHDDPCAGRD
jgi:hypothetical protein